MSSDNGIYVLSSMPKNATNLEYRVAYASAIDNIAYYPKGTKMYRAMLVSYFGRSKVFCTQKEAWDEALRLNNQIGYTEYGICEIPFLYDIFPDISEKEAEELLKKPCFDDFSDE